MKRIRNSLKVIISLVSVFVVAVATIVTVILVNNKRKSDDEPASPSFMLTNEQKLLVNEINAGVNSSVSAGKQSIFEYSSKFDEDDMSIDSATYFNDSVWWSGADQSNIVAYVFKSESANDYMPLASKLASMSEFSSYENPKIIRAVKNHFLVKFKNGSSLVYAFVTVDNYVVTVNKIFDNVTLDLDENVLKRDEKDFKFFLGEFYFVILSYDAEGNAYYEFFEYKDNYDGYESFKLQLSSSELEQDVDIPGSNFNMNGSVVVNYSASQGFILEDENNNPDVQVSIFGKVTLTQTRVESTQDVAGSELVNGDYYTYTYVLKIDGEEKTLDMTGYNKVNVVYAGENYFGLFFQKINENHSLVESGEMVYFDYNLNKVANYSAKSSSSTIIYSNGTLILTKEGMFSAKNEVQCSKVYGFENLNAEFYQILASGNFVMKDSRGNLIVYNFNLSSATEFYMENIIAYLDDNSLIFVKNDIYYIYYFSTNTVTQIDYVVTSLTEKTGLFFTGNETDGYALRSSKKIIQDNIESFTITGDYVVINTAGDTKTYCISSEVAGSGSVLGYSFESAGATQTEYYEKISNVENYSITSISTPEDDVVYSYADKVETQELGDNKMLINATHCFTGGDYTNINYDGYYDYFELAYTGQNSSNLATYRPLRIYYRVEVSDGDPKLTIISFGHHSLATVRTGLSKDYNINDCSFIVTPTDNLQIGASGTYKRLGTKDSAYSKSYDYSSVDSGYTYRYTGSYSNAVNKGFKILADDEKYILTLADSTQAEFYSKAEVYGESIRVSLCLTFDYYTSYSLEESGCKFGQTKLSDSEFFVCKTPAGYYDEETADQKPDYTSDYFKDFEYYDQLYIKPAVIGVSDSYYNYSTLMDNENYGNINGMNYILTSNFVKDNIAQYDLTLDFDTIAVYNGTYRTMYNLCLNDKQYYNANEKTMLALGYSNDFTTYLVGGTLIGLTTPNIYNNTSVSSSTLYDTSTKTYISNMIEFKAYSNTSNYMKDDYTNVQEGVIEETNTKYYYMTYNTSYYIYQSGGLNKFRYIYCVYEPETFYLEIDYNVASSTEDGQGLDDEIDYLQRYTGITIGNDFNSKSTFTNTWVYKNYLPIKFDNSNDDKYEPENFKDNYTRLQSGIVKTDGSFEDDYISIENIKETSAVIHEYKSEDCRAYYIIIDGVKYFFEKNTSITFRNYEDIVGRETAYFMAYKGIDILQSKGVYDFNYGFIKTINESTYYCLENNDTAINNFYYQQGDESVCIRIAELLGQGYVAYYHRYNTHERVGSTYNNTHYSYSAVGSSMTTNDNYSNAKVTEKFRFSYNDSIIISELPVHNHYKFKGFDVYYYAYENGALSLKKLDYQITFDSMTASGVEINPFTISSILYYLASGKMQNFITDLNNYYTYGKNNETYPIRLVAIWDPIEITINAVLWTQERLSADHLGLKYANGEIKGGADSTIITDSQTVPVFYKAGDVIDQYKNDEYHNTSPNRPDGLIDELIQFSYLKTKTFASIYDILAEKGYNSAGIYSVGLECQFAGWAFRDSDGKYRVTDRTFYGESGENYSETTIASYVGETTKLTVYAYYFTMFYNFSVSLDPMGGAVDGNASKDYFSGGMANSTADPAQYKLSVKKTRDEDWYKYTAGYSETGYDELSIPDGSTNYFKRFDNIYYCGDTLSIKLEINQDNYYFRRIVVSNLTLKNDSGAYRKYTVVFEYDIKQRASAAGWSVDLECEDDGTSLGGTTSKDGSTRNFVFGSNAYNSDSNVFKFDGSERELTISISNISWPGTLDVEKQVLSGYGGFEMEVVVDNYTLENEDVSFSHVDKDNQTIDNDKITATYDRSSLISSQPLTDQYGNAIGGSKDGYIWIDSTRYHVTTDATTAESGYYEVSAIGGAPLKQDEEYNYESFIRQDITQSTTMFVYYNSKTKMVYYLANVQAYNIESIYDEDDYVINLITSCTLVCNNKQAYFIYDGKTFYGYKSNTGVGNIFVDGTSGYYVFTTIASSSATVSAVKSDFSSYKNLFYTSGNDKIYCNVRKNGSIRFRAKTDTLKADAVPSMGRKISFNNTRMLVIDPEQSLVHNSQNYSDNMSISTNYELKYYISSLQIGNYIFTFDQVTRNVTSNSTKLSYGYLNLNHFSSTSMGSVDRRPEKAGVTFDYFGETYTINDAYKLTINIQTGYNNASTVYYYFIARSPEGFIRYFLVYDETISSLENRTQVYDINVTFKPMVNKLNVNVTEEDVYMHSNYDGQHTSFYLSYRMNSGNMVISNSGEITYNSKNTPSADFKRNLFEKYNIDSESFLQYYFYQSVASDDDLITDFANTTLTSVSWSSLVYFDPTQTFRLQLYAKSGYVIKTFKIYVGKLAYKDVEGTEHEETINQCITFELDIESSFENLLRYSTTGNYSYTGTVDDVFKSMLVYRIKDNNYVPNANSGYELNTAGVPLKRGLMYSNYKSSNWTYGNSDTYTLDYIYTLIGSMYEDVKIDITTTSYTEFLFENGSDGLNPLLKENVSSGGKTYVDIDVDQTYFTFLVPDVDDDGNPVISELSQYDDDDNNNYILRYYPYGTSSTTSGNLSPGTIRMIFFGTGSKIQNGLHVLATTEEHSVYFTNARFYNEEYLETTERSTDAFKNLAKYSGRTKDDEKIKDRTKTDKMVYFLTDKLAYQSFYGFAYECEPKYFNLSRKNSEESSHKFFVALTACLNEINVETSSYLYNNYHTSNNTIWLDTDVKKSYNERDSGNYYQYKFGTHYNGSNPENKLLIMAESSSKIYQLDNLYKTNSWFNDTVLSNIQYYSNQENYKYDNSSNILTWADRDADDPKNSALTSVKSGGLDFSWAYYEIAGYYLKYIMVEIADLESYYVIDVSKLWTQIINNSTEKDLIIGTFDITDSSGYSYQFVLRYVCDSNSTYGRFEFYPVAFEKDESGEYIKDGTDYIIDLFKSVSLMSNNIKVAFLSNAYDYQIVYHGEYTDGNGTKKSPSRVSTYSTMKITQSSESSYNSGNTYSMNIYYDSMIKLDASLSLSGYTFIGWGSENYYSNGNLYSRYTETTDTKVAPEWNSSSSWYDPTPYFVQAENTGLTNASIYNTFYSNHITNSALPGTAFYVNGGYFMTDTGYKGTETDVLTQNYNFFSNYITMFSEQIGKWKTGAFSSSASKRTKINLYPIFKVNTYAIQFNPNNSKGDNYYIDFNSAGSWNLNLASDNIRFTQVETMADVGQKTVNYVAYINFDTNNWVYSSSYDLKLLYAYCNSINNPYTISSMDYATGVYSNPVSKLAIDMYGYTWLGWYYTKLSDVKQSTSNKFISVDSTTMVIDSLYSVGKRYSNIKLPSFNMTFIDKMKTNGSYIDFDSSDVQAFVYYGQHKASSDLNRNTGYVYFYDYTGSAKEVSAAFAEGLKLTYNAVNDYLNVFEISADNKPAYEKESASNIILSYYDTSLNKNAYEIKYDSLNDVHYLSLNKIADKTSGTMRVITLFAAWAENTYTTIYEKLDGSSGFYNDALTNVEKWEVLSSTYNFNDDTLASYLINTIDTIDKRPATVGWDFVGWSFSFIPNVSGSLYYDKFASSVNTASPILYLCKDLLAYYTQLDGATGTSDIESNILMINDGRLSSEATSSWILNKEGTAEKLGDSESISGMTRYVYLFPVWREQTFSMNISLNIKKEELANLYEKDSDFTVALYESDNDGNFNGKFTGVSTNFYTYQKTAEVTETDGSKYTNYFNDLVANISFEIGYTEKLSEARLSFAGKTYHLKDLFVTSAGYYFLGLMYNNALTETDNDGFGTYVVKNTLKSILKPEDGLVSDFETGETGSVEYLNSGDARFCDLYSNFYITRQTTFASPNSSSSYSKLSDGTSGMNVSYKSTNFGHINLQPYNYNSTTTRSAQNYYIMSEIVNGQYYNFIIVNNTKFYVVYYFYEGEQFKDVFTFDKTFLYYNETINGVNYKYTVYFDANGNPYYVKDSFKTKVSLNSKVKVAIYKDRRNTLLVEKDSGGKDVIVTYNSNRQDGSLMYSNGTTVDDNKILGKNASFSFHSTRGVTLYAHWQKKTITSTIENGNNVGSDSSKNPGLAGWYSITNSSTNTVKSTLGVETYTSSNSDEKIELEYDFYSNIKYEFLPYYNGRYLSEMILEFDTISETNSGMTSSFVMIHNTLSLRFVWDNEKNRITIETVSLNGISAGNVVATENKSTYFANKFSLNILSVLDKYNLSRSATGSGFYIYEYNKGSCHGRLDINPINIDLTNVMTSIKFTCKYSIQTYNVQIYNVVGDTALVLSGDQYKTTFSSLEAMLENSNYNPANSVYGASFNSSLNFNSSIVGTISTDCAQSLVSYNVPYYYFVNSNCDKTTVESNIETAKILNCYYGFDYIYFTGSDENNKNKIYYMGSTQTPLIQYNYSLDYLIAQINNTKHEGWYTFRSLTSGYVMLDRYASSTPIKGNISIYGYYLSQATETKVLFYYWDQSTSQYVQYMNNVQEYTSGTGSSLLTDSGSGYKISQLPSSGIGTWPTNEQFVGYIYINATILSDFKLKTEDPKYGTSDYENKSAYSGTQGDAYSQLMKSYSSNYWDVYYTNYIASLNCIDLFKYRLKVYNNEYYPGESSATIDGKSCTFLDAVRLEVKIDVAGSKMTVYKDFKMLNASTVLAASTTYYAIPIFDSYKAPSISSINKLSNLKFSITTMDNAVTSNIFKYNSQYTIYYHPDIDLRIAFIDTTTYKSSGFDLTTYLNTYASTYSLPNGATINSTNAESKRYGKMTAKEIRDSSNNLIRNEYSFEFNCLRSKTGSKISTYNFYVVVYYAESGNVAFTNSAQTILFSYDSSSEKYNVSGVSIINKVPTAGNVSVLTNSLNNDNKEYFNSVSDEIRDLYKDETQILYTELVVYIGLQILQKECLEIVTTGNYGYYYSLGYSAEPADEVQEYYDLKKCITAINNGEKVLTDSMGFVRLVYSIAAYSVYNSDKTQAFSSPNNVTMLNHYYESTVAFDAESNNIIKNDLVPGTVLFGTYTDKDGNAKKHAVIYLSHTDTEINYFDCFGVTANASYSYNNDYPDLSENYYIQLNTGNNYKFSGYRQVVK